MREGKVYSERGYNCKLREGTMYKIREGTPKNWGGNNYKVIKERSRVREGNKHQERAQNRLQKE